MSVVLMINLSAILLFSISNSVFGFCSKNLPDKISSDMEIKNTTLEIQQLLKEDLKLWYPLILDTISGGYLSDINYKWEPDGIQNKMIVTQARHIWTASTASRFFNNDIFLKNTAEHGYKFLKDKMWDNEHGGFYDLVNKEGIPVKENNKIIKKAYGNSFAIYGLAAYYKASGDSSALDLAKETFYWLEKNSYDPKYGGYFQFISGEGLPLKDGFREIPPKDQNSSIHLLEAFTELYSVWKNEMLKERLNEMLPLIRDKITTEKGYMNLFFSEDWTPVSFKDSTETIRKKNYEFDHVSFGHDVETAYLLIEASEALGKINDSLTLKTAKMMVDHVITYGWDSKNGGLFDRGYYFKDKNTPEIIKDTKEWWSQAEALNTFLLMNKLYPDDKNNYFRKFTEQWNYIKNYLIDNTYGGWYWGGIDKAPEHKTTNKASIWKGNYHTSRSLMNCLKLLKKLRY